MVAAGIGKEGSRKPSLFGRKRYKEIAKTAKNNKHPILNKLKCAEQVFELKILND